MSEDKKLDIVAIKTDTGKHYMTERKSIGTEYNSSNLKAYLFDGVQAHETFHGKWVVTPARPQKMSKMVRQDDTNHRYELQDKALISDKIPEFLVRDDVAQCYDYEWTWNDDMKQYRSLYKLVSDKQPDLEVPLEFDIDIVLTVKDVIPETEMSYDVQKTEWKSDGLAKLTQKDISYRLLDKIIYPEILLPQRPCRLTSLQAYKIVRQHIRDNMNSEVAEITSDYDFCFTVKKRIRLAKLKKYTVDVNNSIFQKRKRKPKHVKREQSERGEVCFEMTHAEKHYKGYTPIKGFEAATQKELKNKIDAYCEGVISFINTPISECKHCNGDGIELLESPTP